MVEAARALAKGAFHGKIQGVRERIQGAVSWQCDIISTLSQRSANRWMCPPDVLETDPAGACFPRKCSCLPNVRLQGKTTVCQCAGRTIEYLRGGGALEEVRTRNSSGERLR